MNDEKLFQEIMSSLGVRRIGEEDGPRREVPAPKPSEKRRGTSVKKSEARRRPPRPPMRRPEDPEDAAFLEAMTKLDVVPDKDGRAPKPPAEKLRRLKPSRSRDVEPEDELDLHGQTVEQAEQSLERFVVASAGRGLRTILVVTGKGLRSATGTSVLKQAVERWLYARGKHWVKAFSEAPRPHGGRGAYVFYLR